MAEEKPLTTDVKRYVSNTDRDIYTVSNIPEEVIAVIFAYVSRSPKGFRENIGAVIQEEELGRERASKFHEKWVLNYGHASVAEHAVVHVGIERVSRLFSSILELSNEYLSFTEYSQRYQKPSRGDFYVPRELDQNPALRDEYLKLNDDLYTAYSGLNEKLLGYLKRTEPPPVGTDEKAHMRALEKIAFEDARYALTLATFTNLGMTANARAIEDSLTKLLSNKYEEVRRRAEEIKDEVRFSVPTLVKYANENRYIKETREELVKIVDSLSVQSNTGRSNRGPAVNLLDLTGKGTPNPEEAAIDKMIRAILFEHSDSGYAAIDEALKGQNPSSKLEILKKSLGKLGKYDNPVNALRLVGYEAEFVISEACWHQLLRHRKTDWIYKDPSVSHGITVPPNMEKAGVTGLLKEAAEKSEELYEKLTNEGLSETASYVVTNAHQRRVIGGFDLWELYHLINLRMSEGAQWDIKNVTGMLANEIRKHHPNLVAPALKRVK
ncbi:MAG TPA: FAD-dependent thymidylate synthase [Thermodesulfobacteriota bacterium]|nr:FAD-dependent thymidylate synthase [Thermodesulfobacteriota bacterium]